MPLRLEPVRDRKLYRLVKAARERSTSRGEVLFRRGDPGGEVYVVRAGHVCVRLGGAGSDERTVVVAGPSELFGEEGMVPRARCGRTRLLRENARSCRPSRGLRSAPSCAPRSTP